MKKIIVISLIIIIILFRIILTIGLLYGVFIETGIFTTSALAFIAIVFEINGLNKINKRRIEYKSNN